MIAESGRILRLRMLRESQEDVSGPGPQREKCRGKAKTKPGTIQYAIVFTIEHACHQSSLRTI